MVRRALISLVALGLFMLVPAATQPEAAAYVLNPDDCRWSGSQPAIGYRFSSVVTTYKSATRSADSRWDATYANGYFYETTSTSDDDVVVLAAYYGANGYVAWVAGSCDAWSIWNDPLYLRWNRTYMESKTSTQKYMVGIHEFGHVYGLWHNQTSGCNSGTAGLMYTPALDKYASCGWTSPTGDDVNGVRAIY